MSGTITSNLKINWGRPVKLRIGPPDTPPPAVRGGSWVVISRVKVTILITHIRGPITPLIATQEPPSRRYFGSFEEGLGIDS